MSLYDIELDVQNIYILYELNQHRPNLKSLVNLWTK